jgi:integrase
VPKLEALADGTGYRVKIRHGTGNQGRFRITIPNEARAERLAVELVELGVLLGRGNVPAEVGARILERTGDGTLSPREARAMAKAASVEAVTAGPALTFAELGQKWTDHEIADAYPDHVKRKATAGKDAERLAVLNKTIGRVPVTAFTLADAELAMRALPRDLSSATRRQYAQIIARLLALAVYPLKLRPSSPLPRGFLPKVTRSKATAWLYPAEDARLLACVDVPLVRRVLYGFLAREGCRCGEALALTWADLDLDRGVIRLDENKTDDPRAWALGDGVAGALGRLAGATDLVFAVPNDGHLAEAFRADLALAGIDRAELFERTKSRQPIRLHDLRATFVTLALAAGRSETWVSDRTGHRSSVMIANYRRAARTASELGLGELDPLEQAVTWAEAPAENRGRFGVDRPPPRKRVG